MPQSLLRLLGKEEDGQDLVEYSLLLAFIALSVIALLAGDSASVTAIWTSINSTLTTAAS